MDSYMDDYLKIEHIKNALITLSEHKIKLEKDTTRNIITALSAIPRMKIIHCKDCKWHTSDDQCTHPHWDCEERTVYPTAMEFDYCKHGERE